MYKMTLLFRQPAADQWANFEEQWAMHFRPLAEQMPGLRRVAVGHVVGSPNGKTEYTRFHEFYFDSREALDRALTSEVGVKAGRALMGFAGKSVEILFLDVFEEANMDILNAENAPFGP